MITERIDAQAARQRAAARAAAPGLFTIDLQVTERCNLRCQHCYQEDYTYPHPPFETLLSVVRQCADFIDTARRSPSFAGVGDIRASFTLTGGEPLVHPRFFDLLDQICADSGRFSARVLTNATLVDRAIASELSRRPLELISISLDGLEGTHDLRRGKHSFARTLQGIAHLVAADIPTVVSFTAGRDNYRELPEVARLVKELGVLRLWSDRIVPTGQADRAQVLSPREVKEYVTLMHEAAAALNEPGRHGFKLLRHRALQFHDPSGLGGEDSAAAPYQCWAGVFPLSIQADGSVYPCRRLPIPVGNVRETSLLEIYSAHPTMLALRNQSAPSGCGGCHNEKQCAGGLVCLTYAMTGGFEQPDPGCWIAHGEGDAVRPEGPLLPAESLVRRAPSR